MDWTTYNKSRDENPIIEDWAKNRLNYEKLSKKYKLPKRKIKSITDDACVKTQFPLKLESDAFAVEFHHPTFAKAMERLNLKTFEDLLKYPFKELAHKIPGMGEKTLWRLLVEANKLGVVPNTEGYKPR